LLVGSDADQSGGEPVLGQAHEPESLVVRRVPRDVDERRQSHEIVVMVRRPFGDGVDQLGSEALAGMIGVNGNLLDVCAAVHDFDERVRHGYVVRVGLNPDVLGREEIVQLVERGRWIVCDGAHPDVSERFARGDLDLLQCG